MAVTTSSYWIFYILIGWVHGHFRVKATGMDPLSPKRRESADFQSSPAKDKQGGITAFVAPGGQIEIDHEQSGKTERSERDFQNSTLLQGVAGSEDAFSDSLRVEVGALLRQPLAVLQNKHLLMMGDSITRYQYLSLAVWIHTGKQPEANADLVREKKYNGWMTPDGFYPRTTDLLKPYEVCDCYRNNSNWSTITENRYYYNPEKNIRLTYIQWYGDKVSVRGQCNPAGNDWTWLKQCPQLQLNPPKSWSFSLSANEAMKKVVPGLRPDFLLMNVGIWSDNTTEAASRELLHSAAEAVRSGLVIWKDTATIRNGCKRNNPQSGAFLAKIAAELEVARQHVRVFHADALTSSLGPSAYWDCVHFNAFVYNSLNDALLKELVAGQASLVEEAASEGQAGSASKNTLSIRGVQGRYISRCLIGVVFVCVIYNLWSLFRGGATQREAAAFRHFDALRFPLTIWVIAFHYLKRADGSTLSASPMLDVLQRGRFPVIFFLLLSGFLTNVTWKGDCSYVVNIMKRFSRMYLCYVISLGLDWLMICSPLWERTSSWEVREVGLYMTMLQVWTGEPYILNGPAWYIAALSVCILVGPALFRCFPSSGFRLACVASVMILIVPLWTLGLLWIGHGKIDTAFYKHWFYPHPLCCLSLFLGGMCVSEAVGKGKILAGASGGNQDTGMEVNSSGDAAPANDARTEPQFQSNHNSGIIAALGYLGDLLFFLILGLVFFPLKYLPSAFQDDQCGARNWAEDGCTGTRVIVTGLGPVLWSLWLLLSCYGGIVPHVLSSPWCFGDINIFGNPTLAMFLFQDPVAMLLLRIEGQKLDGQVIRPPRLDLELDKFCLFVATLWSVSFIWSNTIERWIMSGWNSWLIAK